jgi:hypothetical protein
VFLGSGRLGALSNIRVPGASSGGKTSHVNDPMLLLGVEEVSRVALSSARKFNNVWLRSYFSRRNDPL